MSTYSVYPRILDWDGYVTNYLPAPSAIPPMDVYIISLTYAWQIFHENLFELVCGIADPDSASGSVLAILGSRVNESRGGLSDTEYRRITEARKLSNASLSKHPDLVALMEALTGEDVTHVYNPTPGTPSVSLHALVPFTPTEPYKQRAAEVVRDAVALSAEVEAVIYEPSAFIFGTPSGGFSLGTFAHSLPVT